MHSKHLRRLLLAAVVVAPFVGVVGSEPALAAGSYIVASTGDDTNDGLTPETAFRTVGKCAEIANPGDTCSVRAGTYRETVRPARSGTAAEPIRFTGYSGERPVITGADDVRGWVPATSADVPVALAGTGFAEGVANGRVSKAFVATNPALFADQLFLGSQMMTEARWPNSGLNPLTPTKASAGPGSGQALIMDPELTQPAGFWSGATVHVTGGQEWMAHTGTVLTSVQGSLTYESRTNDQAIAYCAAIYCAREGNPYYITGVLGALDAPNEWHYDRATSTMFFWAPEGMDPNAGVSVKQRNYAFDLRDRSHIEVSALDIFSSTVITDDASTHNVIDGIRATYISHFVKIPTSLTQGFGIGNADAHADDTGIILAGLNNTLKNSVITYSAGPGVIVMGKGNNVINNLVSQTVYGQTFSGGIVVNSPFGHFEPLYGEGCHVFCPVPADESVPQPPSPVGTRQFNQHYGGHATVMYNTVVGTPGSGITVTKLIEQSGEIDNTRVAYNNVFNAGALHQDAGPIYVTVIYGTGNRIDHNWAHDYLAKKDRHNVKGAYTGSGVYLDGATRNVLVDHNVSWNNAGAGLQLNGCGNDRVTSENNLVYNNTVGGGQARSVGSFCADGGMPGTTLDNNIFRGDVQTTAGASIGPNNLNKDEDPLFVDPARGDFHLGAGSPAIDRGTVVAGVTDGYAGTAPDIGAYDPGTDFTPGCTFAECAFSLVDDGEAAVTYEGGWSHCTVDCGPTAEALNPWNYAGTLSSATDPTATATLTFSGTGIDLHMERNQASGIAAVSIDGGPEEPVDTFLGAAACTTATQSVGCVPDLRVGDQMVYGIRGLDAGTHTVKIRPSGTKHAESAGATVILDRATVQGAAVAPATPVDTQKGPKLAKPPKEKDNDTAPPPPPPADVAVWTDPADDSSSDYLDLTRGSVGCPADAPGMLRFRLNIENLDPAAPNQSRSYAVYRMVWEHDGARYFVDAVYAYSFGTLYTSFADGTFLPDGTPVLQHPVTGRFTTGPGGGAEVHVPMTNVGITDGERLERVTGQSLTYDFYSFYTVQPTPNPGGTVVDTGGPGLDVQYAGGTCSAG